MKKILLFFISCLLVACAKKDFAETELIFEVEEFGAVADGETLNTEFINKAIDSCAAAGGGTIIFSEGVYLSGSIHLRSNVNLEIKSEAIILGAPNNINAYDLPEPNKWSEYQDFGHSHFRNALIWGEHLENISIYGGGTINGGGITRNDSEPGGGDKALSLKLCDNVSIEEITFKQGGHFAILANGCDNLTIDSVLINTSRDGIDLMSCSNVSVTNCKIHSIRYNSDGTMGGGDDAIGIKSDYALGQVIPSENIVIENCFLSSGTNGIQFGSETVGPIKNVTVKNIEIVHAAKAGLGITTNDGSVIENVRFEDIKMSKAAIPIFMIVTDRGRAPGNPPVGKIKDIHFDNILVTDSYDYIKGRKFTATISGLPGNDIENVTFNNIDITYKGGGTADQAIIEVPYTDEYAPRKLGIRPASGFYIRHTSGLDFDSVAIKFEKEDFRPVMIIEESENIQVNHMSSQNYNYVEDDIILRNVNGFSIQNSNSLGVLNE